MWCIINDKYLHKNKIHRNIKVIFGVVNHNDKNLIKKPWNNAERAVNKSMKFGVANFEYDIRMCKTKEFV